MRFNLYYHEIINICIDLKQKSQTLVALERRKSLFEATCEDLGIVHTKGTNDSVLNSFKYFDKNEGIFLGTISVGTRTGRPCNEIDLKKVNSEARFDTRLEAFYLLSNYWLN